MSIQCINIQKSYGSGEDRVDVLKDINLSIVPGELTLLVGPSGSGKTTLISIMATILSADAGKLILLDQDIGNMSEKEKANFRSQNIGMVFQSFFLIPTLTVAENMALPLIVRGISEKKALDKAMVFLEKVHLERRYNVSPASLSKGQQQRVAIGRALMNDAPIVICDEPTSSLDHNTGFEIMELLHAISKEEKKTLVVVTHDPRIFPYGDRVVEMSDGEIIPAELLK